MLKTCNKCKQSFCFDNFYKNKLGKNGLMARCKPCAKNDINKWQKQNKEKVRELNRINTLNWRKNNKEKLNANSRIKDVERRKTDINYKLRKNLRVRLYSAIKNNTKTGSAVSDLGCTIEQLKIHLEQKFQPGMTWDNYGEWHIDHIYPLSKVDLTIREELLKVCNFNNLQPLWAKENCSKNNKLLFDSI